VRAAVAGVATAAGLLVAAPPAHAADPPPVRLTGIDVVGGHLTVSVGLQDLFGPPERERLTSGFSTRVLIRVALQDEAEGETLAHAVLRAEIVFDIWDEKFSVRTTHGLGAERRVTAKTADLAIWHATALIRFPVTEASRLRQGTRYVVLVRGDLNPISEDLLADVRRWLVLPARGQRRIGAGDSFFGSFVSIFVNPHIEDSERQVRFTSQPFTPPAPVAPPSVARPTGKTGAPDKTGKPSP
jgi:hypothetical protein